MNTERNMELTIKSFNNKKISKNSFVYHLNAYCHACGSDAITFVVSMDNLEVTLTLC